MSRRDIPNIITVIRLLLIAPIVLLLLQQSYQWALILFVIAGISDGLDGFLARQYGWTSRFGSMVDPLADKLLMISCFSTLAWLAFVPKWLWLVVVLRDVVIMIGVIVYKRVAGRPEYEPSLISKLNTLLQIILITALLFYLGVYQIPLLWLIVLMYLVFLTTVVSFINYVWVWGLRLLRARQQTNQP